MTIDGVSVLRSWKDDLNRSAYTSDVAISPSANSLVVAAFFHANNGGGLATSMEGCGLSWTSVLALDVEGNDRFLEVWTGRSATPSSSVLTFTTTASSRFHGMVFEIEGSDVTFGQNSFDTLASTSQISTALGTTSLSTNGVFYIGVAEGANTNVWTERQGFVQIGEERTDNNDRSGSAYTLGSVDTCGMDWTGSFQAGILAWEMYSEVAAASGSAYNYRRHTGRTFG